VKVLSKGIIEELAKPFPKIEEAIARKPGMTRKTLERVTLPAEAAKRRAA